MVQLQNADRLNIIMELGTTGKVGEDEDGMSIEGFVPSYQILAGQWSLSTSQIIQQEGLGVTNSRMYVIRHRPDYSGITQARIGDKVYEITSINQDPYNNPTAYDQLSLREVDKNG